MYSFFWQLPDDCPIRDIKLLPMQALKSLQMSRTSSIDHLIRGTDLDMLNNLCDFS